MCAPPLGASHSQEIAFLELAGYTTNTTTTSTTFSDVSSSDVDSEASEASEEEEEEEEEEAGEVFQRTTDGDWTPTAEDVQLSAAMVGWRRTLVGLG